MFEKYNVLVFEGRARQSLPLARAFKKNGCNVYVLCNSKLDISYWSRYFEKKFLGYCNQDNEEKTLSTLINIINKNSIDLIVPTTDFAAMILSKYKEELKCYTEVASNDWCIFEKAADKNITMDICEKLEIPHPKTIQNVRSLKDIVESGIMFPIVVKPRIGYGAIGFKKISNEEELYSLFKNREIELREYVIQEYIPQTSLQYECAMFIDNLNYVKTALVFSKNRWFPIEGGSSTLNITVNRPEIIESCSKLLQAINWRGAADIDLIEDPRDSKIKIMEINPRVSGSVKICFESGVDLATQMVEMAKGKEVTKYSDYQLNMRLRCSQTDFLWFIKSPNRFKAKPSWFSVKNTRDQLFYIDDPLPYIVFSISGIINYRKEIRKRK